MSTLLFEGAKQEIIDVEKTGDFSKFNQWQNDITNKLQKIRAYSKDSNELFKIEEQIICQKAFSNSITNYFYYYCLNLEKIAIMRGTAVALGFKAFDSEDKRFRRHVSESILNKWLGTTIPIDPLARRPYNFVGYRNYGFVGCPVKNDYYEGQYIKGKKCLPLLLKRRDY